MKGISITGDLEKDQQILVYGIGGLIVLIVFAMILLLVLVIIRRKKAMKRSMEVALQPLNEPQDEPYKPKETQVQDTVIISTKEETPIAEVKSELKESFVNIPTSQPETRKEEKDQKIEVPESTPAKEMSLEEKLAEIRQRMAEIKKQNPEGISLVLPKVGETPEVKTLHSPEEKQERELAVEPVKEVETDQEPSNEIIQPSDLDEVEKNARENETDDTSSLNKSEVHEKTTLSSPFDKKDLPMKKMTFAEWVEIFKQ